MTVDTGLSNRGGVSEELVTASIVGQIKEVSCNYFLKYLTEHVYEWLKNGIK